MIQGTVGQRLHHAVTFYFDYVLVAIANNGHNSFTTVTAAGC